MFLASAPAAAEAMHQDQGSIIAASLVEAAKEDRFSGAVIVAKGPEIIFRGAFGKASREYDRSNTPETQFNLASANKPVTAIAIMRLIEQGRLSLDDTVEKHLGGHWLPREHASRITIRHLLSHTSGLGDYLDKPLRKAVGRAFGDLRTTDP